MNFSRTSLVAVGFALSLMGSANAQDTAEPAEAATTEAQPSETADALEVAKIPATAETVVATVNGNDITVGHIVALGTRLPPEYLSLDADTLFNGILDQLIQQSLLAERVSADSKAMKYALENEQRALLATEAINDIGTAAVTDKAVEAAYQEQYASVERLQDFSASHILVESEDEAKAVIAELEAGADFAEVAKEKSIGPSGPRGGELGWISAGQTAAPFEEAARALEPGQISAPTETQFGWHVIKMTEYRDAVPPTLAEVRDAIEAELSDKAISESMRILDEGATIERMVEAIDTSVVTDATLLDD